jgi:hypothetical protein
MLFIDGMTNYQTFPPAAVAIASEAVAVPTQSVGYNHPPSVRRGTPPNVLGGQRVATDGMVIIQCHANELQTLAACRKSRTSIENTPGSNAFLV